MKTIIPYEGALLNPRNDATFKTLFTSESKESRLALKSFLEAILEVQVHDIRLEPNELSGDAINEKQSSFDITCTIDGERVNIEMQGLDIFTCYDRRAEYNVAHLLNHFTTKGLDWSAVPKAFQISVLNFNYDSSTPQAISHYRMRTEDNRHLSDRMNIYLIELQKMAVTDDIPVNDLTPAERWCKFLLEADKPERQKIIRNLCMMEDGIMAATSVLSEISQDEANWVRQTSHDRWMRDMLTIQNQAAAAQKAYDEAMKGIAETKQAYAETKQAYDKAKQAYDETKQAYDKAIRSIEEKNKCLEAANAEIALLRKQLEDQLKK